jgi:hypothetical protein
MFHELTVLKASSTAAQLDRLDLHSFISVPKYGASTSEPAITLPSTTTRILKPVSGELSLRESKEAE